VRWRTSLRSQVSPAAAQARRGLSGTQRLAIVAGLVAVLVASLVTAAFAGVFTNGGTATVMNRPAHPAVSARSESGAAHNQVIQARSDSRRLHTSCRSVAHIGDSTSVGMVSPEWLPDPAQRLAAQYADVGVQHAWIDASGGRSIVEEMPGQLNGYRVATGWDRQGFRGCWVIALGTNDTANVSVGSNVGLMARVQEMMSAAHGEPVMWVNTQTDLSSGPWSETNMRLWNDTLVQACRAYPNMRVFNWAGMVEPYWHLSDGIHYTSAGYAIRAHAIADALARAFPARGHSANCVVSG
jgi:hypothetical protein